MLCGDEDWGMLIGSASLGETVDSLGWMNSGSPIAFALDQHS
jgi:hypothetical protein